MEKFSILNKVEKTNIKTSFGLLTINNIQIDPLLFEDYIYKIVFDKKRLEYIFATSIKDINDFVMILKRFIPHTKPENLDSFVDEQMKNVNFYSFFAEGLISIILNDLYNYSLSSGTIDIRNTLIDSHTGVDACMYDLDNNVFILGESKFYKDVKAGINKIISDFTSEKGFFNKLDSFKRNIESNQISQSILLRKLDKEIVDEISLNEFLKLDIKFAGFVLHQQNGKIDKYFEPSYYDNLNISTNLIQSNISNVLNTNFTNSNFNIIFLHIPISNKKEFIKLIIEKVYNEIEDIRNGKHSIQQ